MKRPLKLALITIISGLIIYFLIICYMDLKQPKKNNNSNSNNEVKENDTIIIDYEKYQKLRSEVYENDTFAILIMNSEDEISDTFKKEVLYSFKDRKSLVYEIDEDKLSEVDMSGVIRDITEIQKSDEPTMITPTLLVSKKGKIVLVQEGLIYSTDLISMLDEKGIE